MLKEQNCNVKMRFCALCVSLQLTDLPHSTLVTRKARYASLAAKLQKKSKKQILRFSNQRIFSIGPIAKKHNVKASRDLRILTICGMQNDQAALVLAAN